MKSLAVVFCALALIVSLYSQVRAYQVRDQAALMKVGAVCTRA
jgi:hypothetical protein